MDKLFLSSEPDSTGLRRCPGPFLGRFSLLHQDQRARDEALGGLKNGRLKAPRPETTGDAWDGGAYY